MSDDFIDPLNDPRFPNRPNTPDYWRLSEVGLFQDGQSQEGEAARDKVVQDLVDEKTVMYYVEQRIGTALEAMPPEGINIRALLMATWVDGFCIGGNFQKRGGHRDQ